MENKISENRYKKGEWNYWFQWSPCWKVNVASWTIHGPEWGSMSVYFKGSLYLQSNRRMMCCSFKLMWTSSNAWVRKPFISWEKSQSWGTTFLQTYQSHRIPSVLLDAARMRSRRRHVTDKWCSVTTFAAGVGRLPLVLPLMRCFKTQGENIHQASFSVERTFMMEISSLSFAQGWTSSCFWMLCMLKYGSVHVKSFQVAWAQLWVLWAIQKKKHET